MQNANAIYAVDTNRTATAKQLYAVGRHFGKIHGSNAAEAFRLAKVFSAIMMRFNAEHADTPITHGDVSKFFELDKVPAKFVKAIKTKPKASKKPAASKKPTVSEKPKASEKPTVSEKPTASEKPTVLVADQSVKDFAKRLDALASRQTKTENRVATLEAKMELMMAFLETNPDA